MNLVSENVGVPITSIGVVYSYGVDSPAVQLPKYGLVIPNKWPLDVVRASFLARKNATAAQVAVIRLVYPGERWSSPFSVDFETPR